jgi:hypothetical protein
MDLQKQAYMIEYIIEKRLLGWRAYKKSKQTKKASALNKRGPDKAEA